MEAGEGVGAKRQALSQRLEIPLSLKTWTDYLASTYCEARRGVPVLKKVWVDSTTGTDTVSLRCRQRRSPVQATQSCFQVSCLLTRSVVKCHAWLARIN